jgi:hypothetical protein
MNITRTSDTTITVTARGKRTRYAIADGGSVTGKTSTATISLLGQMHGAGAMTDAEMERAVRAYIRERDMGITEVQALTVGVNGSSAAAKIVRRTCASILEACAV